MEIMERETLESLRFTFQRVLIPIVVIIGCVGNGISVVVLTRRTMRCTTNIYLTALAIVDIIFLVFMLLISLKHHHALHQSHYIIYWKMFGPSLWICDAAAYSSIWLTVCFTVERYIAVCHPIRGKVLCTESRAKKVIAVCFVVCFLLTLSTVFEYQIEEETRYFTSSDAICPIGNSTLVVPVENSNVTEPLIHLSNQTVPTRVLVDGIWCEERPYLMISLSEFGKNHTYKTIFYILTTILFVFGPLILLVTFNCYLIAAVHRSQRLRRTMTNNFAGPSGGDSSSQQENKITIILIAVCTLFFLCQSPSAILLLYTIIAKPNEESFELLALGNVLNFLITINAACNFILYCVLSDKYRKTMWQLMCGSKRKPVKKLCKPKTSEEQSELEKLYSKKH